MNIIKSVSNCVHPLILRKRTVVLGRIVFLHLHPFTPPPSSWGVSLHYETVSMIPANDGLHILGRAV